MTLAAVAWLTGAALALSPGETLVLDLTGEIVVSGTFRESDGQVLTLMVDGRPLDVALPLVEHATRDGLVLDPQDLADEARAWAAAGAPVRPGPHPFLAGTASALLPGSGHLLLRDWRTWAGYAAVDAALLSLAGWFVFHEEAPKAATTFLALDAVFRAYAVGEAVRDARRMRPAQTTAAHRSRWQCHTVFAVTPLGAGGVAAAAGYQCRGSSRLEETGPIH